MKHIKIYLFLAIVLAVTTACRKATVPATYDSVNKEARIYPDYKEVTVPVNIAPLHFEIDNKGDEFVTRISYDGGEWVGSGMAATPDEKTWRTMVAHTDKGALTVEVFVRKGDKWKRFKPFHIYVSQDEIDPYISYRIIAPSYVAYEELTIRQRNLTNYDEQVIYGNMTCSTEEQGQCINCHNYQNYNPNRMQFHARQGMGGTMIVYDGKVTKVNLKTDSTLSAGVYPAWHPTERLIVYSTNATGQTFHTANPNKIEVQDKASDLILYDMDKNEVSTISAEPNELETYPCWSPDGKYIYYASAHFEKHDTATTDLENMKRYREFKYNLYRRPFDLKSKTFGAKELVLDAAAIDKSATLPRISPDGKRLMFAMAEYGCFHIWHKDADLYVMELTDTVGHPAEALSNYRNVQEINSPEVESYHTWSSNNRWVVFSSRRNDGNYTRPFIAHIDKNGKWGKPFELPQEDPDYHRQLLSSYNLPEFMSGPVTVKKRDLVKTFEQEARQALYRQK